MPAQEEKPKRKVRAFWSGTISFGLVNIPVELFPANRKGSISLRMLDEEGTPLSRRYYCPEHDTEVHPEHILRGYQIGEEEYIIVRDDELEAIEPKKTREIDLRRFVKLEQVPPLFFERAYFLTPSGDSTKAYRLLAEVMQRTRRAGVATFVMRNKEYLVAILSEDGILRAETLRFEDEIRTPNQVGLAEKTRSEKKSVDRFSKAIKKLSKSSIAVSEFADEQTQQLQKLIDRKVKKGTDVVTVEEYLDEDEEANADEDLMSTIRESLLHVGASSTGNGNASTNGKSHSSNGKSHAKKKSQDDLDQATKTELYEQAQQLEVEGRSKMSKPQLIRAIRQSRSKS